jgi:hypothetical protein
MNSDSNLLHQSNPIQQKPARSFKALKPVAILIIIPLIATVASTGGYLLGIKTHQYTPQSDQRAYIQPSPTNEVQSTVFPSLPYSAKTIINMRWKEWKMYTDEELGLSFNYPNDWEVKSSSDKKSEKGHHVVDIVDPTEITVIGLFYYENSRRLSLEELDQKLTGNSGISPGLYSPRSRPVNMTNGITAYYQEESYCVSTCQSYVWPSKDKVFQLIIYPHSIINKNLIINKIFLSIQHE